MDFIKSKKLYLFRSVLLIMSSTQISNPMNLYFFGKSIQALAYTGPTIKSKISPNVYPAIGPIADASSSISSLRSLELIVEGMCGENW